jgi:hypothetical protein
VPLQLSPRQVLSADAAAATSIVRPEQHAPQMPVTEQSSKHPAAIAHPSNAAHACSSSAHGCPSSTTHSVHALQPSSPQFSSVAVVLPEPLVDDVSVTEAELSVSGSVVVVSVVESSISESLLVMGELLLVMGSVLALVLSPGISHTAPLHSSSPSHADPSPQTQCSVPGSQPVGTHTSAPSTQLSPASHVSLP